MNEMNVRGIKYEEMQKKVESLENLQGFFINPLWICVILHLRFFPQENSQNNINNGVKKIKKGAYIRVATHTLNTLIKKDCLQEERPKEFSLTEKGKIVADFFMKCPLLQL